MVKSKLTRKKLLVIVLSFLLAFSFISPKIFCDDNIIKDETVYVTLDESGKTKDIIISDWIKNAGKEGAIYDKSTLNNITNIKGYEKPKKEGDVLVWGSTGKDIFYQGTLNKKLPISISIHYYLNDKEISPKEISGKSGNFKMSLKIRNYEKFSIKVKGEDKDLFTPFITAAVVTFPVKNFSKININSGTIISDGQNQIVTFFAIPGLMESLGLQKDLLNLEEELLVTAEVEDFQLGPTIITSTPSIPDIKLFNGANELNNTVQTLAGLRTAGAKLENGSANLSKGGKELQLYVGELGNGMDALEVGALEIDNNMGKLNDGLKKAVDGSSKLQEGIVEFVENTDLIGVGAGILGKDAEQFSKSSIEFSQKANVAAEKAIYLANKIHDFQKDAVALEKKTELTLEKSRFIEQNILDGKTAIDKVQRGALFESFIIAQTIKTLKTIGGMAKGIGVKTIGDLLERQVLELEDLKARNDDQLKNIHKAASSLEDIDKELAALQEDVKSLRTKSQQLKSGINKVSEEGKMSQNNNDDLKSASIELTAKSKKINITSTLLKGGIEKLYAGAKVLVNGGEELVGGLNQLKSGSDELKEGSNKLRNGSATLSDGVRRIESGAGNLADGVTDLNNGIRKFNIEGIERFKINLGEGIGDLEELLLIKDELLGLSKNYETFSGIGKNMTGTVKFIMKTDEIKPQEHIIQKPTNSKKQEEGFFHWLFAKYF